MSEATKLRCGMCGNVYDNTDGCDFTDAGTPKCPDCGTPASFPTTKNVNL